MLKIRQVIVSLPAVIAAAFILIGWSLANEYIHCVYNIQDGFLHGLGYDENQTTYVVFEAAVFIMGAVAIGAATCIIVMGIKKK